MHAEPGPLRSWVSYQAIGYREKGGRTQIVGSDRKQACQPKLLALFRRECRSLVQRGVVQEIVALEKVKRVREK